MTSRRILIAFLACVSVFLVTTLSAFRSSAETCRYHADAYEGLELTHLAQELESTGLIGRVHGAASTAQLFVMSVQEPGNFFNRREFSLLANDEATQTALGQVERHDLVCIRGNFIPNPSPQEHIWVNAVDVLEPWPGLDDFPDYERGNASLPESAFVGKVHAIGAEGRVLVVEYKDGVFPIFVDATDYTEGLFRGDIIRLAYTIQDHPPAPTHLQLDLEAEQPLTVIDAIADWHQTHKTLTGQLVQFPQSPQLRFDVYAIDVEMEVEPEGVKRTFTLVNFENMDEFQRIQEKLATLWNSHLDSVVPGRNRLINTAVRIEASGVMNVVSPNQANPQILLDSADDVQYQPS